MITPWFFLFRLIASKCLIYEFIVLGLDIASGVVVITPLFFLFRLISSYSLNNRNQIKRIVKSYLIECWERMKECLVLVPFIILPLLCWSVASGSEKELDRFLPDTTTAVAPPQEEIEEKKEETKHFYVRATVYNPTKEQCGDNPWVTSSGDQINQDHLKNGKIKWVALSTDLLEKIPIGSKIRVIDPPHKKLSGIWTVKDKCGIRNTVDFLRPWPDTLGLWNVKIEVVED